MARVHNFSSDDDDDEDEDDDEPFNNNPNSISKHSKASVEDDNNKANPLGISKLNAIPNAKAQQNIMVIDYLLYLVFFVALRIYPPIKKLF